MTHEEAKAEINKVFEPAFANYIITALTEGATPSERKEGFWDVLVIDPHGKPIARTTSFREATRIIEADVRMLNRLDGTEDPFQ